MIFDDVTNYYFWSVFIAWFASCFIKTILYSIKHKKVCLTAGFSNGGMPSSHSAAIGSMTFAILLQQGLSPLFFLSFVITALFLKDAITVRKTVGLIGEAVNKMLKKNKEPELQVIYGHTLKQVFVGLLIGIVSSGFFFLLFF